MEKRMLSVSEKRELWNFCNNFNNEMILAYEFRKSLPLTSGDTLPILIKRGESYNKHVVKNEREFEIICSIAHLYVADVEHGDCQTSDVREKNNCYRSAYIRYDDDNIYLEFYHKGQFNNPPKTSELYITALRVLEQREEVFEDWL